MGTPISRLASQKKASGLPSQRSGASPIGRVAFPGYSVLSASIGSSREARMEG